MDTIEYPNIFGCNIMYPTNIQIYSDTKYLPNKYRNIFFSPEIAQIQIQIKFKKHFIQIFKYLYSSLTKEMF